MVIVIVIFEGIALIAHYFACYKPKHSMKKHYPNDVKSLVHFNLGMQCFLNIVILEEV